MDAKKHAEELKGAMMTQAFCKAGLVGNDLDKVAIGCAKQHCYLMMEHLDMLHKPEYTTIVVSPTEQLDGYELKTFYEDVLFHLNTLNPLPTTGGLKGH